MARDRNYLDYITLEVFREVPGITARGMFGGFGLYKDAIFFALISDDVLYMKVTAVNRELYQAYGSRPFVYTGHKGKTVTMSYWELPAEVLDNPGMVKEWVELSVLAATQESKRTMSS